MVAGLSLARHAAAALFAALSGLAAAQGLPDPTRPPANLLAAPVASEAPAVSAPKLQSVLIGTGRTPAAVISGELVLLGGRVGDARLARITERSAVLKGPRGEMLLPLLADTNQRGKTVPTAESTR